MDVGCVLDGRAFEGFVGAGINGYLLFFTYGCEDGGCVVCRLAVSDR